MAKENQETVVGVFTNNVDARQAIRELKEAGFTEDQIGIAGTNRDGSHGGISGDEAAAEDNYGAEGALAGAAAGAGLGALWGMAILAGALPAIGPAIAGGTLAVLLSSAAAGAATAGLAGALIGMGLSKEEAEFYESELKAGRNIVTVHAGNRCKDALAILRQYGGYDISDRGSSGMISDSGDSLRASHKDATRSQHRSVDVPVSREDVSSDPLGANRTMPPQ